MGRRWTDWPDLVCSDAVPLRSFVMKTDLCQRATLSVYWLTYTPTLTRKEMRRGICGKAWDSEQLNWMPFIRCFIFKAPIYLSILCVFCEPHRLHTLNAPTVHWAMKTQPSVDRLPTFFVTNYLISKLIKIQIDTSKFDELDEHLAQLLLHQCSHCTPVGKAQSDSLADAILGTGFAGS